MPRVGSKQSIVWTPPATQRAIVTFCWLPPDSRRTSPPARASICSRRDRARRPSSARRPRSIGPQRRRRVENGQGDVLADRALHQQRLGAVGGDVHEPGPDGVGRMAEGDRRAVDEQLAAARARRRRRGCRTARPGPGPRARRRRAPRPGRARTRRRGASSPARQAARRRGGACRPAGRVDAGGALGDRRQLLDDLAEHQLDDPLLGALGHVDDADRLALAQHRRPVADGGDLDQPVRDEDDRPIAALLAADDLEDALGEVRGQRRGHLVEHQHVGLDRERAGEVDDPERGQRQAPRQARQIEVLEAELVEPVAERLDRRLGQAQVGPDVEVRDERRLLVDRDEAAAARLGRRVDGPLAAADGDPRRRPGGRRRSGS